MNDEDQLRAAVAQAALNLAPPIVRQSLIEDADFMASHYLCLDAVISFGDSGVDFQRSIVFDAVRKLLGARKHIDVSDKDGRNWRLLKKTKEGTLPQLSMVRHKQRYQLPDFSPLAPDSETRLRGFTKSTTDAKMPKETFAMWCRILAKRALNDDEFTRYNDDLTETPRSVAEKLRAEILGGESDLLSLVPRSRRYYERLIGVYDGSATIQEYAAEAAKRHIESLIETDLYQGFLHSLLLSAHASVVAVIPIGGLDDETLLRAYVYLAERGDHLSQVGALELGFRVLPKRPVLAPVLEKLIVQIRDDDPNAAQSQFNLLSSVFILVDGDMSRRRIFATEPPFYRRLASLAQATLIVRQLAATDVSYDHFASWAFGSGAAQFYLQSFADMRLEPRWNPDYSAKEQMKADFIGRIILAAYTNQKNLYSPAFKAMLFGRGQDSLYAVCDPYQPFFPGALEGAEDATNSLPPEIEQFIEAQLGAPDVKPESFVALVNASMVFRLDRDHAEKAAAALKLGDYRLSHVKSKGELVTVLNGLAAVAAITRSAQLADDLRILVRRYLRDPEFSLSVEEAIRIGGVAAASRRETKEWRDYIGDFLTELSFGNLNRNDGEVLDTYLHCFCRAVPELWVNVGRARAAVKAFMEIQI